MCVLGGSGLSVHLIFWPAYLFRPISGEGELGALLTHGHGKWLP